MLQDLISFLFVGKAFDYQEFISTTKYANNKLQPRHWKNKGHFNYTYKLAPVNLLIRNFLISCLRIHVVYKVEL